jgi:hypothetical protein
MATVGENCLTLSDWAKRVDPKGSVPLIVELLEETNEILEDMLWVQGNLPTGHRTTVRDGDPTVYWRLLNQGVAKSKSKTRQVDDVCGMMEGRSEIDVDLAKLNGNTNEFRFAEDSAFTEAMNKEMAAKLFYGNTASDPEQIHGLAPRYPFKNSPNVIDALGTGTDLTSVWLICWGQDTVHGIFPKGSKAGLEHKDRGQEKVFDDSNNPYYAYVSTFQWKPGLVVRDWRYVVRICNLESSGTTNTISTELLIKAIGKLPSMNKGSKAIYLNSNMWTRLNIIAQSQTNVNLTLETFGGKKIPSFWGIPLRKCDAILNTESHLTTAS